MGISDDLTGRMPIVPHGTVAGVDCCGCIIAEVEGNNVELRCNECSAVIGVVQIDILRGLLGVDCATATCPHCGRQNAFPAFDSISAYICENCGKAVESGRNRLERVEINDDTCKWYEFEDAEPIAVMRCVCGQHPDVDEDSVGCGFCGRRSPLLTKDTIAMIEAWNEMVDPEE